MVNFLTKPLTTLLTTVILAAIVSVVFIIVAGQSGLLSSFFSPYRNNATVVVSSIQELSVLTTVRYNFSSLVTTEREMPGILAALYGERQVLVAVGHVNAGIDLSTMTDEDVVIEGNTMRITLPAPTLQDCFLNESQTYVADRETGIFARSAPELDDTARQYAMTRFRDAALEQGILEDAREQGEFAVARFISLMALPDISLVNVEVEEPAANAELPVSCT